MAQAWELERDKVELQDKLDAIKTHMEKFPKEKDPKYSGRQDISTQHIVWNMPYFLTDLDTWHEEMVRILEESRQ